MVDNVHDDCLATRGEGLMSPEIAFLAYVRSSNKSGMVKFPKGKLYSTLT